MGPDREANITQHRAARDPIAPPRAAAPAQPPAPRALAWLLIRPGEGRVVAYLWGVYLLLGLGLALGQGSSEALFLKRVGVEYLPHVFIGTGMLLAVGSVLYMELVDRLRPARMLRYLLFVIAGFLLLVGAAMPDSSHAPVFAAYLLGCGVAAEILIVHFNLYLSSLLDARQAARLSPLINAGARIGAIVGGVLLASSLWSLEYTALVWLGVLLLPVALVAARHRGEPARSPLPTRRAPPRPLAHVAEGLRFARRSRLLRLTGGALFLLIVLLSLQEYVTNAVYSAHFTDEAALAAFFGWFYAGTNAAVLILQTAVAGRLLRRVGLKTVNLIFPVTSLLGFAALAVSQNLIAAAFARFGQLGALRAFRIPAANLFYNAIPNYMQGRARAVNLAVVLPLGLIATGALLLAIPEGTPLAAIAGGGMLLSVLCLYIKARKYHAYREALLALIQGQVFTTRVAGADFNPGVLDRKLTDAVIHLVRAAADEREILVYVEILLRGAPSVVTDTLLTLAPRLGAAAKHRLLTQMATRDVPQWIRFAQLCLSEGDTHLRASAFGYLWRAGEPAVLALLHAWLTERHPRLRAAAAAAAIESREESLQALGRQTLERLLAADDAPSLLAGLSAIGSAPAPSATARVRMLLQADDARVRAAAITALGMLPGQSPNDLTDALQRAAGDNEAQVRAAAIKAVADHPALAPRLELIAHALHDRDPAVRRAADEAAAAAMPVDSAGYRYALARYFAHFPLQALLARGLARAEIGAHGALLLANARRHVVAAERKRAFADALTRIAGQAQVSARSLLALVFDEESRRHIEHALLVLEQLDERDAVNAIRAALTSRDPRLRAQALESLSHMENSALVKRVVAYLDAEPAAAHRRAIPLSRILRYGERSGSDWLKHCVCAVRADLGDTLATTA